MGEDPSLKEASLEWFKKGYSYEYSYHFKWLGRPIIQYPQDMIALQEIIWDTKPDLIVETGIAHGGSLIFSASMLEMIGCGEILGIDIDIREHNRVEIEKHPLFKRITMFEGSSTDKAMAERVHDFAKDKERVMVILDSNHTHEHAAQELELYSSLVKKDSYLVVFDTIVEDLPAEFSSNRPWGPGDNPKTAVREFLKTNDRFVVDQEIENKLLITAAPEGYLKCVRD